MYTVMGAPSFSASPCTCLQAETGGSERLPGQALWRRSLPKSMAPHQIAACFPRGDCSIKGRILRYAKISRIVHPVKGLSN
jgi:hypothetical protein